MDFLRILKIIVSLLVIYSAMGGSADVDISIGNIINTSINSSADPCEDFYSYACGNYDGHHGSTHYQELTGYLEHKFNVMILNLMDSFLNNEDDKSQTFVEKSKRYLQACRAETQRNLTRYFEEIKPGPELNWPLLEMVASNQTYQWPNESIFDVWLLLGKLQSYGLNNVLINQEINVAKDGEISVMLEPVFIENNSTLPQRSTLMVLLKSLGVKKPCKIVSSLRKIDRVFLNMLENHDHLKTEKTLEMTYGDLEIQYPRLNLNLYLNELVDRKLPTDTFIMLRNPEYFQYLNDNLDGIIRKQELCNYLMMKFLHFLVIDSAKEFKSLDCVKDLRNKFDLAVNFIYYHHIFGYKSKLVIADIVEIFRNLINTMNKLLQKNSLSLANSQLKFLREKLINVKLNMGNLPELATFAKVQTFYDPVPPLNKNNYYKNQMTMLKHRFSKSLNHAQSQTFFIGTDNSLGNTPLAFYVPKQNMIILSFSSLLEPMYHMEYNDYYKYSQIGFILAHELVHAFDTYALNFNSQGKVLTQLHPIAKNSNFENSLECFQNQLSTDSIDERIADIVAINILDSYTNDFMLIQNSTNRKYFYLNLAQLFCGNRDVKFIDHDSDSERLNQIVLNSYTFGQTFKCPRNSKMNPEKKCKLY